jgi:hypothetical protein
VTDRVATTSGDEEEMFGLEKLAAELDVDGVVLLLFAREELNLFQSCCNDFLTLADTGEAVPSLLSVRRDRSGRRGVDVVDDDDDDACPSGGAEGTGTSGRRRADTEGSDGPGGL